jgi:hypothetical protein
VLCLTGCAGGRFNNARRPLSCRYVLVDDVPRYTDSLRHQESLARSQAPPAVTIRPRMVPLFWLEGAQLAVGKAVPGARP